jgi:nicotinate-nucleotide adenylyltransferase
VSNPQRIGVFGGTFDPVHNAHCDIARAALESARLDRVIFVVAARPPHKSEGACASADDRYAMACAAVRNVARLEVSRVELDRDGPSYTVDTLREIHRDHPEASLFLIIGYDSLLDLPKWKDPAAIVEQARLLVVPRPGLAQPPPAELAACYDLLPFPETALSSTEVRDLILSGQPFDRLVPPGVAALIREREIYHVH